MITRIDWRRGDAARAHARLDAFPTGIIQADLLRAEMALEACETERALTLLPLGGQVNVVFSLAVTGWHARMLLAAGDERAARQEFERWKAARSAVGAQFFIAQANGIASLDDALCVLGDAAERQAVLTYLESLPALRSWVHGTGPDYLRGAIALTLDRADAAERWFQIGIEWATRWGLDTIIGRNFYGLAQVEARRGHRVEALAHLEAAGTLFAKRGAKVYLDQVVAMQAELRG